MSDENLINSQNSVSTPTHKNLKDNLATLGQVKNVTDKIIKTANINREQITINKEDISSLKEEMGKNYLDDAKVKRSLDALWKLNQGISYQFETDDSKAYQKDIPSGAKLASVKKIGGRTIVWNQLATNIASNWNFESSNSATVIEEEDYMSSTIKVNSPHILWERYNNNRFAPILGQKYYVTINVFLPKKANVHYRTYGYEVSRKSIEANIWYTYSDIISPQKGDDSGRPFSIIFSSYNDNTFESGDKFMFKNIMVFDLTKMFGAGNEPSTPEEFEAMFPEDYYPYNEGTLMSMPVNEVVEKGRNLLMLNSIIEGRYNVEIGERLISEPSADISVKDSCVVIKTKYEFNGISLCTDILPTGNYIFSYETIGDEVCDTIYIINNSNIILQKTLFVCFLCKRNCQLQQKEPLHRKCSSS